MIEGYLAVGNRCAIDFSTLVLPVSQDRACAILWRLGFRRTEVDLLALARSRVGVSWYRRGAHRDEAPNVVDCSSFVKWLYAKLGIWLPRHTIDQYRMGTKIADLETEERSSEVAGGELVFLEGRKPYWNDDPAKGIGHVGMLTQQGTVIHAASAERGVAEDSFSEFVERGNAFRGIVRVKTPGTITLECPSNRIVEWSGELRNIVLQNI